MQLWYRVHQNGQVCNCRLGIYDDVHASSTSVILAHTPGWPIIIDKNTQGNAPSPRGDIQARDAWAPKLPRHARDHKHWRRLLGARITGHLMICLCLTTLPLQERSTALHAVSLFHSD
ncbi:hypothetical protein RJ55_08022 [Drechmeria coniospora]|nr:hypothetical protein RJ55_08022 [Drechmeria coniospora]